MPTGYSLDARLAAKKVELDVIASKFKRIKAEYEAVEKEYADLAAQARHQGLAGHIYTDDDDTPKVEKIKKSEKKE